MMEKLIVCLVATAALALINLILGKHNRDIIDDLDSRSASELSAKYREMVNAFESTGYEAAYVYSLSAHYALQVESDEVFRATSPEQLRRLISVAIIEQIRYKHRTSDSIAGMTFDAALQEGI